ncbi:class I SAM-dependent methyltransferase [Kibdelosporangium aridum]|uniref:Class I SAM-dependent methyltransferase n=1 Tax=Kibdelosporangium aridum TaxID=2030 RepID=A0A428Z8L1_KIBAR|nr:class I SAM-dependent methyltransferase [Kibdelosporangium aridum]RSM84339.1 class I SAM-dependent methyltransferase [Kibdelosporangium aridum]
MEHGVMDEAFWDDMYRETTRKWSGKPNPQLVTEASDLKPGTALDVGCGEGADAIWLAEHGWRVTGADVSSVALERAKEHSTEVEWLHLDLTKEHAPDTYDLVTAHYVHLKPKEDMVLVYKRIAEAVAPGGTLLIVGHDKQEMHRHEIDVPDDIFFGAEEITSLLSEDEWKVEVAETRTLANPDHRMYDFVFKASRVTPR